MTLESHWIRSSQSRKSYRVSRERFAFAAIDQAQRPSESRVLAHFYHPKISIARQERRLVDPPSQVVAGVRTVTTKMDGRCDPHVAAPILYLPHPPFRFKH